MDLSSLKLLITADDVHQYVYDQWHNPFFKKSHKEGGYIHQVVEDFARLPRAFCKASDLKNEWTHFSPWWGVILNCEYEQPAIGDLRYLHEIWHSAYLPYIRDINSATLELKNFNNEREASTVSEMAIYLNFPELRQQTFKHPIFMDRFLFPEGDFSKPNEGLLAKWKKSRSLVFQELMYERVKVVMAKEEEIDNKDPQIVWLRRYGNQAKKWLEIWSKNAPLVENAMLDLEKNCEVIGRDAAMNQHMIWLLSGEVSKGTDIPFIEEAKLFRKSYDELIERYDEAMARKKQKPVRHEGEQKSQVNTQTSKGSKFDRPSVI
ncbi:MAG: hypothetical protein MRY79_00350 [Alphaproteobacteria bacterium]|nr:hypothetical protein [Alphaproteobacteria bacterium]